MQRMHIKIYHAAMSENKTITYILNWLYKFAINI